MIKKRNFQDLIIDPESINEWGQRNYLERILSRFGNSEYTNKFSSDEFIRRKRLLDVVYNSLASHITNRRVSLYFDGFLNLHSDKISKAIRIDKLTYIVALKNASDIDFKIVLLSKADQLSRISNYNHKIQIEFTRPEYISHYTPVAEIL